CLVIWINRVLKVSRTVRADCVRAGNGQGLRGSAADGIIHLSSDDYVVARAIEGNGAGTSGDLSGVIRIIDVLNGDMAEMVGAVEQRVLAGVLRLRRGGCQAENQESRQVMREGVFP